MTAIDTPKVEVFGKENCPNCEDLHEFLEQNLIPHKAHSMDYHGVWHDGWREDGSVEALAAYQLIYALPIVKINDEFYSAEEAKKILYDVVNACIAG